MLVSLTKDLEAPSSKPASQGFIAEIEPMRLFVVAPDTGQKIHLQVSARSRQELATSIGGVVFSAEGKRFHVNDVNAELGVDNTIVSALVGGLVGTLGGAPGVIAGSAIGALLGSGQTEQEKKQVDFFNGSRV